jgi:hypothetical protein
MAKGQMKSNREKKKPKKDKPAAAVTASSGTSAFAKPKPGKK